MAEIGPAQRRTTTEAKVKAPYPDIYILTTDGGGVIATNNPDHDLGEPAVRVDKIPLPVPQDYEWHVRLAWPTQPRI